MSSVSDGSRRRRRLDEPLYRNGSSSRRSSSSIQNNNNLLPDLSEHQGARLTFNDMAQWPPQEPVHEIFEPVIHRAISSPTGLTVQRPRTASSQDVMPSVHLMRATNANQAYALLAKEPISLNHHGPGWGCVLFAVIYTRVGDSSSGLFLAPERPEYVAIKRLDKAVVAGQMALGGEENPYKEICRMQELGDNTHVLKCIETLEDDQYLYIITPKACEEGTLKDAIPWMQEGLESSRARSIFTQILKILLYLTQHNICHHDLSPDNFMFLTSDRLVAFDLALSLRMPTSPDTGQRTLMTPQGNFGTRAWQPPEVYRNRIFDGAACDLWSSLVILYNLLTGQVLCEAPHPTDISFRYFILAGGLSSRPINERTVEILMETFNDESANNNNTNGQGSTTQHKLLNQSMAHLNLSPPAIELLEHVFVIQPAERWTLAQVIESTYVQSADEW